MSLVTTPSEYISCPKGRERNAIFGALKALFGKSPIEIDFLDGDVRPISNLTPIVSVAPPRLRCILWIMLDPSMNLPNAYVKGFWFVSRGELHDLILLLTTRHGRRRTNVGVLGVFPRYLSHVRKQKLDTSKTRETKNHYDIDYKIYELILGSTMTYSCAFFEDGIETLDQAQRNKISTTIERLKIPSSKTSVLDIGCGWGSITREISKKSNVDIEGISISQEQINYCLSQSSVIKDISRVNHRYRLADYTSLINDPLAKYDRIISVGMLEHVGKSELPMFFSSIMKLLTDEGRAVIHSIVRPDNGTTNRWIDQNIFAGGYIPRGSELLRAIEQSKLEIDSIYYHTGENYQKTLLYWLTNLRKNSDEIISLHKKKITTYQADVPDKKKTYFAVQGYRVWEFYLASLQNIFNPLGGRFSIVQYCVEKQPKTMNEEIKRLGWQPMM